MKTPVLESLFNKVAGLKAFFCEYCEIFKNNYSEDHLPTAASGCKISQNLNESTCAGVSF